jgi:D-3-phosphoglycerate dehydrogenase
VDEVRQSQRGAYGTYIRLSVRNEKQERAVAGTVFSDGKPRIIQIKDIGLEAGFAPSMLYVTNKDKPGFIGRLGTLLGGEKVNIASFNLGRSGPGEDAISLIEIDGTIDDAVLTKVSGLEGVVQARRVVF